MPTGYRIVKAEYVDTAFSGLGAKLYGSHWTSPGLSAVYVAQNESLAILEVLAHLQQSKCLNAYRLIRASFENALVTKIDPTALPEDWRSFPPPPALQSIGDEWIQRGESAILQVPSAIATNESNFIFNPHHVDFEKIAIGNATPWMFDVRLGGRESEGDLSSFP